ncbi:MAG: hypothetical protein Q9217_001481 [Psora testacea]
MPVPPKASPRPPGPRHPRLDSLKKPQPRPRPRVQKESPDRCINPDCTSPTVLIIEDSKLVCESCGTVADDAPDLVTDLQYGVSNVTGQHVVHGHHVAAEAAYVRSADLFDRNRQITSLEMTNMAGKRYVVQISSALQINFSLQEAGLQVFRLASSVNFIQGRRTKSVAAVALYIACRSQRENPNHYMLIDFADVLQLNVFNLGSIYQDLLKELRMNPNGLIINPINPEDLILRFAQRLEFGPETMRVANDAVRIVQRMNRDWMTPGRRPAGICGAALIIAARMNNFRRTPREMVYVVKVNEVTISKRLDEFKVLESSGLTVDEFRTVDLERFADPPAFYEQNKPKRKRGSKPKHVEFDDDGDDLGPSPMLSRVATVPIDTGGSSDPNAASNTNIQLETPLHTQQARLDSQSMPPPLIPIDPTIFATNDMQPLGGETPASSSATDPDAQARQTDLVSQTAADITPSHSDHNAHSNAVNEGESSPQSISTETAASARSIGLTPSTKRKRGRPRKDGLDATPVNEASITAALTDPFSLNTPALRTAIEAATMEENSSFTPPPVQRLQSTSLASHTPTPTTTEIADDELDDDPEVSNCLLGPDEVAIKTRIWTSMNADWIRSQAAKELKHQIAVQNGTYKPRKTRQRKRRRMGDLRQYADVLGEGDGEEGMRRLEAGEGFEGPADAVEAMMKQRAWSSKINYEALRGVYTPSSSGSRRTSIGGAGSPGSGVEARPSSAVINGLISPGGTTSIIEGKQSGEVGVTGQQSGGGNEETSAQQEELDGIVGELEERGIYDEVDEDEDEDDEDEDEDEDDGDGNAGEDDDPYEGGGADSD